MHRRNIKNAAWTFQTANLTVAFYAEPEDLDPAGSFDSEEDIEAVRSGSVEWFCAVVEITGPNGEILGGDFLGGCAYNSVREFFTSHRDKDSANRNCMATNTKHIICHYFPSMIQEACRRAREELAKLRTIPLRAT